MGELSGEQGGQLTLTSVVPVESKRSPDCQGVQVTSRSLIIAIGVYKRDRTVFPPEARELSMLEMAPNEVTQTTAGPLRIQKPSVASPPWGTDGQVRQGTKPRKIEPLLWLSGPPESHHEPSHSASEHERPLGACPSTTSAG